MSALDCETYISKRLKKDTLDTKVYLFYNQEKREKRELHEFHGQSYCSETS